MVLLGQLGLVVQLRAPQWCCSYNSFICSVPEICVVANAGATSSSSQNRDHVFRLQGSWSPSKRLLVSRIVLSYHILCYIIVVSCLVISYVVLR